MAGTELCQAPHQQYQVSGRHDAWVVGDEPAVGIDWQGASVWAAHR